MPYTGKTDKLTFDKIETSKPTEQAKPVYQSPLDDLFNKEEVIMDIPADKPAEKEPHTLIRRFNPTAETPKVTFNH